MNNKVSHANSEVKSTKWPDSQINGLSLIIQLTTRMFFILWYTLHRTYGSYCNVHVRTHNTHTCIRVFSQLILLEKEKRTLSKIFKTSFINNYFIYYFWQGTTWQYLTVNLSLYTLLVFENKNNFVEVGVGSEVSIGSAQSRRWR